MSTTIQKIRSLIQDMPVLVQENVTLDGAQKAVRLTYFPVVGTSVTGYTFAAPTIDEQSGLLTWATAPAAAIYPIRYSFVQLLDATIQDLIDVQDDTSVDTRWVAAQALDAIAVSMALILRKAELLDLKLDGATLAKALHEMAENLRQQVTNPDYNDQTFDIAEQINDVFGYNEKVTKDFLREDG